VAVVVLTLTTGIKQIDGLRTHVSQFASDESLSAAHRTFRQFECIERAIRRRVPVRGRVVVVERNPLWRQRLAELASPWITVVADSSSATHTIGVDKVPPGTACSGVSLDLRPL
jgi:hypothetical protein